ncbi:uncharacterized protein VP01_3885g3 [Puccinia sorghi]|uniref:Retrotransposon gag domain-containing protein n=1 Tax=Puccinia sorghi TaxID=27349 RepID=A0A0L6USY7_9BASI|nr:uncharacterized protein VP01_3885g3 [Puccinia sorghi]
MDALNARLDEVMRMMTKERAQCLTEEMLRRTQACLDAQQHPTPAQPNPAPTPSPIKLAKPQPFDGTRGTAAKVFVAQNALHVIIYPESFPTDASKVAFATLFMQDYTATWCQPYLNRIFNASSTTTANNRPRWPCGTSAKLVLCRTIRKTSTSTPVLLGGPTPRS